MNTIKVFFVIVLLSIFTAGFMAMPQSLSAFVLPTFVCFIFWSLMLAPFWAIKN